MKIQEYIDHLKTLGAEFINMEADVIAKLPRIQLMITACQLDDNQNVIYGNDYHDIVGENTTPTVLITDILVDNEWVCLAANYEFIKVCELEY